jgi:Protein of unknown function (DUF2939)
MVSRKIIAIGVGVLALAACGGWYFGSPYYTLKSIRDAVEAKDGAAVASYVNFPELRKDLKRDLSNLIAEEAKKEPGMAGLGAMLGGAFVDKMIDQVVTPDGVTKVFAMQMGKADTKPDADKANETKKSDEAFETNDEGFSEFVVKAKPDADKAKDQKKSDEDFEIVRNGFSEFIIKNKPKDGKTEQGGLVFGREGLGWKLVGVDLPKGGLGL